MPPEPGAEIVNFPSASVTVPEVVPLTTTLTPGRAAPSSAVVTFPETVRSCAYEYSAKANARNVSRNLLLGIGFRLRKLLVSVI